MVRHTSSPWLETAQLPRYPLLGGNAVADVCVVGGGIAGLATAYRLARSGLRVILLEKGGLGQGQTGRTTAHLTNVMDDRFTRLEELHGERGSRLTAQSHAAAIRSFETIIEAEEIDCQFQRLDGYLFLGPGDDRDLLEREAEAARRAGLFPQELEQAPVEGFHSGPCLRFGAQAQLHPLAFLQGLCAGIARNGGRIHTGTRVIAVEEDGGLAVKTQRGTVRCRDVVLATNSPLGTHVAQMKMVPYRTYAMAFRIPPASVSPALYWDTGDPYHYVRLHSDEEGELLIVGGEDHKTGNVPRDADPHDLLEEWTRARFPSAGEARNRWSGQVQEPADCLAFTGRVPDSEHVYMHTGDSGQGMTHGMIAALVLPDLIQGRANEWSELYSPSRLKLGASGRYLTAFAEAGRRFVDYLLPGDVAGVEDIPRGQGAVVKEGLHPIAVYRDESGVLHERSAVCTHLGCVVAWNPEDPGWDCACHGSRFDPYGRLVTGPAANDLDPVSEKRTRSRAGRPSKK